MNKINVIGIDLAKTNFQIHGVDRDGQCVVRKQLKRHQMMNYFAQLNPCLIGIEAGSGMHYWARQLSSLGHTVKAMAPQFVKPYVKSNKNDANDAEAICEAVQRPSMRFVPIKTGEQQSVLQLHRSRRLLVQIRISLSNHIRSMLLEFGLPIPNGVAALSRCLPDLLEDAENELPTLTRRLVSQLHDQYIAIKAQIQDIEKSIEDWHQSNSASQRLASIPGIGVLTASALVVSIGEGKDFHNGRQLSAYLGLVPRQASSGGKPTLLSISKRGDGYLRMLLVHGARSVIYNAQRRHQAGLPSKHPWLIELLRRTHLNKAAVAQANKTARIAWAVLTKHQDYKQAVLL